MLGIGTVGELAQLPTTVLRRNFGAWGDLLYLWSNGIYHSPVTSPEPPKSISRETTFLEDTADRPFLLGTLRYLAERVGAELRQEGKRARCVVIKVRYANFQTVTRHRTLELPVGYDEAIFQEGVALFLKALQERKERVRLIGIGVADLVPHIEQLTLLVRPEQRWERLSDAIDQVRHRHGFTSLQTGRTFRLRQRFPAERRGYVLKTACLSR